MEGSDKSIDFECVELHLSKYGGGEIILSKEYYNEGIATIYLNHPQKKNAVSGKMMVDFRKCINELENWKEGKAVLLYSLGDNFCSGGDLDFARSAGTSKEGYYMSCIMQDIFKRFRKLPLVSVCLVHGPALGGGAEISLFCDYILVTDNVQLGFVHGKMGLITAFGGTTRLLQLLGERKALEMVLTSRIYNAEDCLSQGLANKIINTSSRIEEALNFIKEFTVHHYSIIQSFKKVIICSLSKHFEETLIFERDLFSPMWGSELNRNALAKHIKHLKN